MAAESSFQRVHGEFKGTPVHAHLINSRIRGNASAVRAGSAALSRSHFISTGALPSHADERQPRGCSDEMPSLSLAHDYGLVGATPLALTAVLGYDEVVAAYYFGEDLHGLWTRNYTDLQSVKSWPFKVMNGGLHLMI